MADTMRTVLDATKLTGDNFKQWAHKIIATAIINNKAKTSTQFLKSIYHELIKNDQLDPVAKIGLLYCGSKNKLDYLANYKPNREFAFDFIVFKIEFVKLIIERSGIENWNNAP